MSAEDIPHGDGREAVLLLPGMTLNGSIFRSLERSALAVDFCTLDSPPATMSGYAALLDHAWRQTAGWQTRRWTIVGHSFGGMLALQWLSEHPEDWGRVRGVVLVAATAGPPFEQLKLRLGGRGRAELRIPLGSLMSLWNTELVTRSVKTLLLANRTRRVDFAALRRTSDLSVDVAGWHNTTWQAMRGFRNAIRSFDVRDRAAAIDIPAIVLHGSRDILFPVSVGLELARLLPNAESRIIEGAAHVLPLTHGHEVHRAVEDLAHGGAGCGTW